MRLCARLCVCANVRSSVYVYVYVCMIASVCTEPQWRYTALCCQSPLTEVQRRPHPLCGGGLGELRADPRTGRRGRTRASDEGVRHRWRGNGHQWRGVGSGRRPRAWTGEESCGVRGSWLRGAGHSSATTRTVPLLLTTRLAYLPSRQTVSWKRINSRNPPVVNKLEEMQKF